MKINNKLQVLYNRLYRAFGPQHWWPGDTPLEVMVGAILTQNTNWQNVERAIGNLKKKRVLSLQGLLKIPKKELAALIKPAGYFNLKAGRLKEFMKFLKDNYQGSIKKISSRELIPLRQQLLEVKGVGPETADSILLYALDKPIFVVDAYTRRILLRHGFISQEAGYDQVQELFMSGLSCDTKLFNEYHALLVRLGKDFCLKSSPKCGECPLKKIRRVNA